MDAAEAIADLRIPPGNRLEKLSGNRSGQHSIRVNDQWRICFQWHDGDAYEIEIVDYHAGRLDKLSSISASEKTRPH